MRSPVAIFVLATVTVPKTKTAVPHISVAAPALTCRPLPVVAIFKLPPVIFTFPLPEFIVVVEVVLVEPNIVVLTAAPVAIDTAVAEASVEIPNAPTPELMVKAPPVEVIFSAPDPDCRVVVEVVLVEPIIVVLTPAPVAIETAVAAASVDIPKAPTPELMVKAPPVEVIANAPDPDCKVVELVVLVDPKVNALTPAPVAIETVVAAASVDIPTAPTPELIVKAPPVEVRLNAPEPDRIAVELVELVEPMVNVLTAAPVAKDTVVADASVENPIAPVPELTVKAPPVEVIFSAPDPDRKVVELVVLVEPNVKAFTPAPVAIFTVVAAASAEIDITPVPVANVNMPFVVV